MITWIVGLEFQVANGLCAQRANMHLEGFFLRRSAAMVDHLRRQKMELDVGVVNFWISSKNFLVKNVSFFGFSGSKI